MKIYNLPRGKGKTTRMIYISEYENVPILVQSKQEKERIVQMSKKLEVSIPEPLCISDLLTKGKRLPENIIVDESHWVLQNLLSNITNNEIKGVKAITLCDER